MGSNSWGSQLVAGLWLLVWLGAAGRVVACVPPLRLRKLLCVWMWRMLKCMHIMGRGAPWCRPSPDGGWRC